MKNTWLIVIIAAVVVGAVVWLKSDSTPGSPSNSVSSSPTSSTSSTPRASTSPNATPVGSGRSYDQLVKDYGNNRIQFDANCRATPSSFSLKTGSQILLDNRANVARTITIDGKGYNLGAYGYQVVTVSSASLPKVLGVNCGSSVNVTTINLQANISGQ